MYIVSQATLQSPSTYFKKSDNSTWLTKKNMASSDPSPPSHSPGDNFSFLDVDPCITYLDCRSLSFQFWALSVDLALWKLKITSFSLSLCALQVHFLFLHSLNISHHSCGGWYLVRSHVVYACDFYNLFPLWNLLLLVCSVCYILIINSSPIAPYLYNSCLKHSLTWTAHLLGLLPTSLSWELQTIILGIPWMSLGHFMFLFSSSLDIFSF